MDVLDKGYIRLLDVLGDDDTPVKAARISYEEGTKGIEADDKLLRYLIKNRHTSPFEMVECVWEVKAPIFVARQWVRHRTANWNEVSARYSEVEDDFYTPARFRAQDEANKQGSVEGLRVPVQRHIEKLLGEVYTHTYETYEHLLELGVAREQARIVLPLATYTRWIWKNDMHNTMHFLDLRLDEHAQWEMRQYAEAMQVQLQEKLPRIMQAYADVRDLG